MDDKDKEEGEETESEDLRDLILQQFASLEPSETSDDDSYKVRLSCILEDDESESSGTAQKDFSKEMEKRSSKTNQESEKGPPEALVSVLSESLYDNEVSDEFAGENVQITDLDDVTLCEKENTVEGASDEWEKDQDFAIKKLKSSDNVHRRPVVVRRRELSSDSSDLDISGTNSAEGPPSDVKIVELHDEEDDENTSNQAGDNVYVESETSADEDLDQRIGRQKVGEKGIELEVVDSESLAPIFAKVSRTYLEKTKSNVKWEENEKIDKIFRELVEEEVKKKGPKPGEHLSIQDVHIRGTSRNESNPPIPPETYLWEELKRLRERGGYPWTYLDKPPFDEATWKKYMEHVYEPINPPPQSPERKPEFSPQAIETRQPPGSSIPETNKQFVRIPSKASLSKKDSMEESRTSDEIPSEGELQERLESRFMAPTPTATSDTTASQSKTDVTSTVLDTSEFEDVPAKQGSLVKTRREQMRVQAAVIQQRLRNQAGRIRNKFSSIQRPRLGKKDGLKKETSGEKMRFKLPEVHAPKISLPDRSKFKFPEKAKFHLPESSRFHLPDRSKFHLPERPTFSSIAERAKIHLPERGKFHLPDKSKFHLPEKARFHLPETTKFHLPDTSKFHLPEKAKFSLPNRPKLEFKSFKRSAGSDQSPTKNIFDFDLKSYPKLFTKHSKDYTTSSPKQMRGRTPPPRMQQPEMSQSKKWAQKLQEMKYTDDDLDEGGVRETDSRKSESLFEKDIEDLEKMPTVSTKSSTSRLSELSDDRKKGVLEEINPDEFFLRQKGISQDDIDMGQYLSREIREAFRSPEINALARMDYMDVDDENIDPGNYCTEPQRPIRGPVKKSILKKTSTSDPSISEDGFKTYPPRRPGRKSRSQSKSLLNEEGSCSRHDTEDLNISRYDNDDVNLSRYDNVEWDEDNLSEYYKTPGPTREYQHYKVPRSHAPVCPSPPVKRRSSLEDEGSHKRVHEAWDEEEFQLSEPPKPMARRKKNKKKQAEQLEEQHQQQHQPIENLKFLPEELEITCEEEIFQKMIQEREEIVPEPQTESPVPPRRTRTRSSGSRSLRSLATESDANRSFHSEPTRDRLDELEEKIVPEERQTLKESLSLIASDFPPPRPHAYEVTDLDDPGFGYATVGKPTVTKPERHKKPERPPPPRRKKEVSVPVYNTYPRRVPMRPLKNYSTLGPSRPPRRKKLPPIERALAERQSRTFAENANRFEDSAEFIEVSGSSKDLQTEKVIEKMKGRPLPPPPRPPRQKSKGSEEEMEPTEVLSLSILRDDEFPLERQVTAFVHEPPFERGTMEEICSSTQTEPHSNGFSFKAQKSSDVIQEFSHEQLRIQQAFLEEMKNEEEMRQKAGEGDENDSVDAELKAEVIRQIEDIIAEEKRIMERKRREESVLAGQKEEETMKSKNYLDADTDMGYASLERRGHRQDPAAQATRELPTKVEKLQVKELEVETLNVHEVQSDQIFVKELQGNRISSPDIDNRGGTMAVGGIDLPPSFIDQIVAKIPWDSLRQNQELTSHQETFLAAPVRPQRRHRGSHQDDSDDESIFQPRKSHRRPHRAHHSTDEDDKSSKQQSRPCDSGNIPELSLQLARACTSAGVQALRSFIQTNAAIAQSLDRELCVQAILCIAVALIAGFFLFGFDAKIVYLHRWDFQFPPQPPNAGV